MNEASEETIENIKRDYDCFMNLNNPCLKSLYLATSGRGYSPLLDVKTLSGSNCIKMVNERDNTFLFVNIQEFNKIITTTEKQMIINFSTKEKPCNS